MKEKNRKGGGIFWKLLMAAAIGVFCFSAYQLFTIYQGYQEGVDEYQEIARQTAVKVTDQQVVLQPKKQKITEEGVVLQPKEPEVYPPEVDYMKLREINPDVVGWIQMEALEGISYPIVKGQDNSYYLHRTVGRTDNFAGSIFMNADNSADFSDPHTIVYGHNMKNGSMFGQLKWMLEKEYYKQSRYFWICTPQGKYRYEIFSMQYVDAASDVYSLYEQHDDGFGEYVRRMGKQSRVDMAAQSLGKDDSVVTLSTCTSNENIRFVVQGRWVGTY